MKSKYFTIEVKRNVAVINFDDTTDKVNKLNSKLFPDFLEVVNFAEKDPRIKAVVLISGKKDSFIAGADINELNNAESAREIEELSRNGQEMLDRLEASKKPVVAAIDGACMGGGLEVALACRYRIATDNEKTMLSLPEVMLGLLPGGGGTQRLPRLIGVRGALDMILTGKNIRASKAKKIGLVDHVCSAGEGLEDVAVDAAVRLAEGTLRSRRREPKPAEKILVDTFLGRKVLFGQARSMVLEKSGGHYPAPEAILKIIERGLAKGMKAGLKLESKLFGELSQNSVTKGLISLFFAQTELRKNRFGAPKKKIDRIAVLGAGLMGAGIAQVSVEKNFSVILKDLDEETLGRGKKNIWRELDKKARRKSITAFRRDQIMSRLTTQVNTRNFDKCRMVIEAVFEDLDLKKKILKEIEQAVPDNCVIASNTSALPIGDIAEAVKRPENVLGMHYFSPVDKMPLLEIITTEKTSKEAAALAVDVGIRQGKTVIVVGDGPGFYTTRILAPFMDEAALLALEGNSFHRLDDAMRKAGFSVGPIALLDEVGIDVAARAGRALGEHFGDRIAYSDPKGLEEFVAKGFLGRKSGEGFYLYNTGRNGRARGKVPGIGGKKRKPVNPAAIAALKKYGYKKRVAKTPEIQDRVLLRMINEAAFCLQEGILKKPLDGDAGAVFGLGFPPFHGGPFRYVDKIGVAKIVSKLSRLTDQFGGNRFVPAQILTDYAKTGKKFY